MNIKKRLSTFGTTLLRELEGDRNNFRKGLIDVEDAKAVSQMANATSRTLRETLNCKKFESGRA
jgi:hypothetical protein